MEQAERISYLENVRDWQSLVEELEKGISSAGQNAQKAAFHLQLGRVLEKKFLAGVKALKHFQDAYKLNPALLESLGEARAIYWELGKLNMVQKLLELELKAVQGAEASTLLVELGDVLSDLGDNDKATSTYARALSASQGENKEAAACLEDVQAESGSWEQQVAALLRAANEQSGRTKGRLLVRAARIARRFAPDETTSMLARAYGADPMSREIAALYEGALSDAGDLARLEKEQQGILSEIEDKMARARAALTFGTRWVSRHQNIDTGAKFLEITLKLDPTQDGAFFFLREVYGKKGGDWDRVLTLAEEAMTHGAENGDATFLLAQAGVIAWREMGNLIRARNVFEKLAASSPEHPQLRAFEAQIGEKLGETLGRNGESHEPVIPSGVPTPRAPDVTAQNTKATAPPPQDIEVKVSEAPPPPEPAKPAPTAADDGKIGELRALAEKQESAKRFNEYVKTLLQLAAIVPDDHEKVDLYMKAAELYVGKFANQAEAVKAYEAVVAIDPENTTAIDYLHQMYEKRRDWEKLLGLQRREAENLPAGPERAQKFLDMAKLATERVKKPDVCIELWSEVIASDDSNPEALSALSVLYERSKEFDKLATVLEKQAEITYDTAQKIQILNKLGTIYGDRLNNDEGAVGAWRTLLTLDPNDRKAQEALKKKYLALGRWDDLEVFYAETGKWDEFIRVLEQQEAKETNAEAKIGMLFKVAELWADKKQKSDRAARAYEKVLELDPQNLRAAESLIPIYTQAGNAKLLANAIEVKLSHQEHADDKLALLREVAALYEGRVKEPAKAFERYLSAFEIAPQDEQSAADAERAAKATQGWDRLIAAYRAAITTAENDGSRDLSVMLRLKLGRVLVGEVHDIPEALTQYRAVYEADGENADALAALESLYRQTQAWPDLLGIYEKKRDLATSPEDKRAINYEIAKLYETEVQDVDKAVDTYVAVLEEEPADIAALAALDVLYGRLERWEPYVDVLRRRIELDNDEKSLIDLKYRLGSTLEKHTGDAAGALENYREILFLDAQHEGAKSALEAMLTHPELKSDAAAILESIYEERGEWNKLISALDILAESETDVQKRVTLRRKIARISSEALTDYTRSFDALAAALKEDPALHDTRFELEKIAEVSEAQKRLVDLYKEIAKDISDAQLAREYWMKVSALDEALGMVDDAAAGYTHVLEIDAADADALAALEQLFVRTQRWEDLIGVIQRRIDLAVEPDAREALYMSMAQVQDERLGQPTDAVGSYRKVLELDPQSARALAALDAILVRQKMWPELAENLEAQLALTTDDQAQLALMLRLAALRETEMNQVETAIEGYRSVLDRDPNNAQALGALERLGQTPEHELAIAEILEPLYRHLGDHAKLIGVHEVQVRRADDAARKVELLHQIAQLYEDAAGDLNQAFATYARALQSDAASEETQQQLERVARATSRFQDLAHVYEELGGATQEADLASSLWSMAARVYEQDIGDQETAIARYRKVLEIDPLNLAAAESLERLFRTAGKYPELSQILQRKAEILEEPHDQKEALFQAAAIEEDMLERPEEAIAVYKKVLDIDGDDVRALDALIKRYLGLSNWSDLLGIYTRKADLVADPEEKKRIYYQVGAVYERELGDVAKAIDTYQKILELDPDDLQALSRLDVLYEQAQNWQELLAVLTRESEMTADPQEAISFQYRIADLYEKRLDDVPRAIELYRDILSQQADHGPTLQALEGLKGGDKDPLGAAAVLEPVYEAASDWMKLVSVHEVQVAHTEDVFQKVELLHRISRLHEDAMDNHGAAFDTYARAVAIDNGNSETLGNLERIATLVNRWPEVATLYDAELDKLTDAPDRFVELGLRVAQIYETQLEDVENAIGRYRRVAEVDAENQNAIRALDRLFSATERWQDLATILAREAEIGQTPDEILDFRFRLGQLYEQRLQDVGSAIASYREVINAAPEHTQTLEALEALFAAGTKQLEIGEILEPLYRAAGDWDKLAQVYEAQLTHTPADKPEDGSLGGQDDRLAAYYRIAELHEEKLVDAPGALEVYIRALKEFPLDERAGDEVARLASVVDGGWDHLANAYADIVSAHESAEVQRTIGKKLARVFEDELGDITKAEETYKYVLSVEPLDTDALSNLDRLYLSLESWPELAQILEQRIKAGGEAIELIELHVRLGEIYETRVSDTDNAIRVFRRLFDELDRTNDAAIAALGRIYATLGAWPELLTVHERELENASGDAAEADIRAKIGHILFEKLAQPERAIETWKAVLDLRGEDSEALGALANLYEQQQLWRDLIDVLERQCEAETADDQRVNILSRKARMFTEKLGQDDLALEDWNRVLDLDFANLAALRAISAIRRRQGEPTELVNALHQIVDRAAAMLDGDELKEVFRELGKTYGEQLGQPFDAADAWRKLLEVGPDFEAMNALEAIYRGEEKWTDVIDVKMQRAAALEDPSQKIEEYRQVAQLWRETVQEPDSATSAWQKILEIDGAHDEAFTETEKLHTAAGRWEPLIELYLARLDTREETSDKTDLLRRIAKVFEEH
ncbi:MAG TPA: tetratricopeptide repeat protein, partial [Polyangiaceae bacterium]